MAKTFTYRDHIDSVPLNLFLKFSLLGLKKVFISLKFTFVKKKKKKKKKNCSVMFLN